MGTFGRLFVYLRPYLPRLAAGGLLLAAAGGLMGLVVSTIKPLVNRVLFPGAALDDADPGWAGRLGVDAFGRWAEANAFVQVPILLFLVFVVRSVLLYFGQTLTMHAGVCFIRDLRVDLYGSIARQSLRFFQQNPTGTILARILHDVQQLQRVATGVLADLIRVGTMVPFLLATALLHEWRIAGVVLVALPLLGYPTIRLGKRLRRASRASLEGYSAVSRQVTESIGGAAVVQGFGREEHEVSRFREVIERLRRADLRAIRTRALSPSINELLGAAVGATLFALAGREIAAERLDPGDFSVVLSCLGLLFMSLRRLNSLYADIQQSRVAASRVLGMMDRAPEIADAAEAQQAAPFHQAIRFEAVAFSYGEEPVLDGVELELRCGEVVALVGASGSGKTTLANLIPRFYDPTAGRVLFDGQDLRQLTLASLRSQIAVVTQETVLFDVSVRENIAYGRDGATDAEVRAAAQAAQADGFVSEMPQGYDTPLGERGVRLSVGQRQRIAIARALLKDPPLLILDEATSALDAESEHLVQQALERLMQDRTSLVIAHRLATVRRADRIVVLEAGRVVEQGSHEELLAAGGRYLRLYRLQFDPDDER